MLAGTKIKLREKTLQDARNDYNWQIDIELSDLDAAPPLTMQFIDYIEDYKDQLRHPSPYRRTFAIDTLDGKHIGNVVYYNIDKEKAQTEVGIMVGARDLWDQGYGTDAMSSLVDYIFRHTNFKRLYLKTLEKNLRAQRSFKKSGFKPCGNMIRDNYHFLMMDLTRDEWLKRQQEKSGNISKA